MAGRVTDGAGAAVPGLALGLISLDFESLDEIYATAGRRGIEWVELFLDEAADESDAARIRAHADDHGVRPASISSLAKLASADDAAAARDARLVERSIRLAAETGARFATFMFGSHGLDARVARERFVRRVAPLADLAEHAGVTLLVENVFSRGLSGDLDTVEAIAELFADLDGDRVRLNFDPGNLAVAGARADRDAYRRLRPLIGSVHLKDVRPLGDEGEPAGHRVLEGLRGRFVTAPLGEGIVDVDGLVAEMVTDGLDVVVSLEPHAKGPAREAWLDHADRYLARPAAGVGR